MSIFIFIWNNNQRFRCILYPSFFFTTIYHSSPGTYLLSSFFYHGSAYTELATYSYPQKASVLLYVVRYDPLRLLPHKLHALGTVYTKDGLEGTLSSPSAIDCHILVSLRTLLLLDTTAYVLHNTGFHREPTCRIPDACMVYLVFVALRILL